MYQSGYDGDLIMIDSSCVRVAPERCTSKKGNDDDGGMGRSRSGLITKIHALVNADWPFGQIAPGTGPGP